MTTYQVDASRLTARLGGNEVPLDPLNKSSLAQSIQHLLTAHATNINNKLGPSASKDFKIIITNNAQGSNVRIKTSGPSPQLIDLGVRVNEAVMFQQVAQAASKSPSQPPQQPLSQLQQPSTAPSYPTAPQMPTPQHPYSTSHFQPPQQQHQPASQFQPFQNSTTHQPAADDVIEASITGVNLDAQRIPQLQQKYKTAEQQLMQTKVQLDHVHATKDQKLPALLEAKIQNTEKQIQDLKTQLEDYDFGERWWYSTQYKELTDQIAHLEQQITRLKVPQELRKTIQEYNDIEQRLQRIQPYCSERNSIPQHEQEYHINIEKNKKELEASLELLKKTLDVLTEEEQHLLAELFPSISNKTQKDLQAAIDSIDQKIQVLDEKLKNPTNSLSRESREAAALEKDLYRMEIEQLRYHSQIEKFSSIISNTYDLLIKEKIKAAEMELEEIKADLTSYETFFTTRPFPKTSQEELKQKRKELESHIQDLKAFDALPKAQEALSKVAQRFNEYFSTPAGPYPLATTTLEQTSNQQYLQIRNHLLNQMQKLQELVLDLEERQNKVLNELFTDAPSIKPVETNPLDQIDELLANNPLQDPYELREVIVVEDLAKPSLYDNSSRRHLGASREEPVSRTLPAYERFSSFEPQLPAHGRTTRNYKTLFPQDIPDTKTNKT